MPAIYSEEIPMTLHIAFVGTDGILLASDRQINRTTNGVTLPHQGDKVLFDEARTRAICWGGYDIARELAKQVLALPDADLRNTRKMETLAKSVFDKGRADIDNGQANGEILVISKNDRRRIIALRAEGDRYNLDESFDKAACGHTANSALYFAERFYKRLLIDNLALLAAHTVLSAGALNPSGIKGLSIVRCREHGFEEFSEEEIETVKLRSIELDETIKKQFFTGV